MKKLLWATIIILAGLALLWAINQSIIKSEKLECQKWIKWEEKYNIQKWADWQHKQCDRFGIELTR